MNGSASMDPDARNAAPLPWLTFILLTAAFFIALHDEARSLSIQEDYLPSEDVLQKHAAEGNPKRQIGFLMVGAFGALGLMRRDRRPLQLNGGLGLLMLFFVAWMLLSLTWADEKALTFRRLVVIATLSVGALAVASRMEPRAMLFFVLFSSTVYLFAGIASEIAMGTFTPLTERYRFCGTIHPNNQGVNCSLIILSGIAAAQTERRWRWAYLGLAGFAFAFLILTGSRTSLASFLVTLAGYLVLVYSGSGKLAFGICALMTGGLAFAIGFNNSFARIVERVVLLGRTDQDLEGAMALTGRIPLWQHLMEYAAARPIQGYGYGSFFTVRHIREISDKQGWPIAECHSVFLEVLMGLGLVGMTTYATIQLLGMARAAGYFRVTRDARFAFLGGLLLLGVIGGMAESTLLVPTMQTFVQFMTLAHFGFQAAPDAVAHHTDHALTAPPVPIFPPRRPTRGPVRA